MNFTDLSWAALLYYYKSNGDNKYYKIINDSLLISKLRESPLAISLEEFEEKVIINYLNIESYDMLLKHRLTESALAGLAELREETSTLQGMTIVNCNLSDDILINSIMAEAKMKLEGGYDLETKELKDLTAVIKSLDDIKNPKSNKIGMEVDMQQGVARFLAEVSN